MLNTYPQAFTSISYNLKLIAFRPKLQSIDPNEYVCFIEWWVSSHWWRDWHVLLLYQICSKRKLNHLIIWWKKSATMQSDTRVRKHYFKSKFQPNHSYKKYAYLLQRVNVREIIMRAQYYGATTTHMTFVNCHGVGNSCHVSSLRTMLWLMHISHALQIQEMSFANW